MFEESVIRAPPSQWRRRRSTLTTSFKEGSMTLVIEVVDAVEILPSCHR